MNVSLALDQVGDFYLFVYYSFIVLTVSTQFYKDAKKKKTYFRIVRYYFDIRSWILASSYICLTKSEPNLKFVCDHLDVNLRYASKEVSADRSDSISSWMALM